jgi:hypothetical protein
MPRTAVTVTDLSKTAAVIRPAGTTADPTNDHVITVSFPLEELVIEFTQTDATGRAFSIMPGDSPPALSAGQGAITQTVAQNAVYYVAGLESGRFLQSDGTLEIDLAASFAGTIRAYRIPR